MPCAKQTPESSPRHRPVPRIRQPIVKASAFFNNAVRQANAVIVFAKGGGLVHDAGTGIVRDVGVGHHLKPIVRVVGLVCREKSQRAVCTDAMGNVEL